MTFETPIACLPRRAAWLMALAGLLALAAAPVAQANNIRVTNVSLTMQIPVARTANVVFDLAWDNSWRDGEHRDAAWVFVKFKAPNSNNWEHAKLSAASANHTAPNGTIDVGSDGTNGLGVFIYSSTNYTGSVSYARTKLRWQYGSNDCTFAEGAAVEVSVHAIEMVYIPAGAFYLGSGGSETGHFYQPDGTSQNTQPYLVSSETNAITVGVSSGNLYYATGGNTGDGQGIISNAFPKGYNAFYCMKYEISQGQYAAFLNKLTATQWATRQTTAYYNAYRHTISGPVTNVSAGAPDRACNYLSWADGIAYADWAALRPLTELEFEKACRGPATPVTNEYAWGNVTTQATLLTPFCIGTDGSGTETPYPTNANSVINCDIGGPARVGIFATSNSTRSSSGAGYYGVMELSGNLAERTVTVGTNTGRAFMGTLGDGALDTNGNATNNADWPSSSTASGAGYRGGNYLSGGSYAQVSFRGTAVVTDYDRYYNIGSRAVRTAP